MLTEAPPLHRLAEAVAPGAAVVRALRTQQPELIALFRADLDREFTLLGQLAASATATQGGLILESAASRDARVEEIVATMQIGTWLRSRLLPIYHYHYQRVADFTFKLLRRQDIRATLRDDIEKGIIERGGTRMGLLDIPSDVKDSLLAVIEEGRELGMNPRDTAKLIEQYVPRGRFRYAGSKYRSQLIARTEALHAQRISSIEAYKATGEIKGVVAFDGDSDEECAGRNGQVFTFDEAEVEAGLTHPNCVLSFAPAN
jgi:hypothetical protein